MKNIILNIIFILFTAVILSNCQVINPCSTSNCKNFAKCIPLNEYNYSCQCNSIYWTGRYCDQPTSKNLCFSNPCCNSTCLLDELTNSYKCLCLPGYTGAQCDKIIDVCQSFPCKNRGLCSNINLKGQVEPNYYRCSCQSGFTGKNCEVSVDQCASNPCLNFGICISKIDGYECVCLPSYNGTRCENDFSLNSYTCSCLDGFFGNKCEIQLNQCVDIVNPCNNNGVCQSIPSNNMTYTCHCLPGYSGLKCETKIDLCVENPCKFGGKCSMPNAFEYKCECPKGTEGPNCEINKDECLSQPCKNNGTCIETSLNSYSCLCPDNYEGINCEILSQECSPNPCKNGGLCLGTLNGPLCLCLSGFIGPFCERNTSACNSSPCINNGTCINSYNNTYRCSCRPPFTGKNCENKYDACSIFNPCLNEGSCISKGLTSSCLCSKNFTGKYCENRVSICETNPCNSNGKCYQDAFGSYKCFCNRGYYGQNCTEIKDNCLSNPCKNGGDCESMINDYKCYCPTGYTSKRCEVELNPCDSNPCFNDGICTNSNNYYNCTCSPDFTGLNCEISLDPCVFMNNCSNRGVCENKYGIGVCKCDQPYYGEYCQFSVDYCLSRPCQNAGRCESNSTSYSCTCTVGFSGPNCEIIIDPCENYCSNNGTCFTDSRLMIGCQCPCNYEGFRCETKLSFCNSSSLCKNGKCVENECGYSCECDCGYIGKYCDIPIDLCLPESDGTPKCLNNGVCFKDGCNYKCNCTEGLTGDRCETKKLLCTPTTCLNHGICTESTNEYKCKCPCEYYSGKNCENYKDICSVEGDKCLNGGTCISKGCDFECVCSPSYTGSRCENKQNPCSNNPCLNDGKCISDLNNDTFSCECRDPYFGFDCSFILDPNSPCTSSPCDNYELCIETGVGDYKCECPPFFTGERCDVRIRSCLKSPCNGGQCIEKLDGGFRCICPIGMTGILCDTIVDTCSSGPCLNNASCIQLRPNSFKCECPPGFTGTLCQFKVDPCLSFPCLNFGSCSNSIDPTKWSCNCNGTCFTGDRCEIEIDPCENNKCNGKGICLNMGSCNSKCLCESGWTGMNCEVQLDLCQSQPCINGLCVNENNSWICICLPGYAGQRCTHKLSPCLSSPCENGGNCIESSILYSYSCNCTPGWTGTSCEIDINECEKNPCSNGGTCIEDKIDSFKCMCPIDYSGELCEDMIDLCKIQPCLNSGKCITNSNGTFSCECMNGFYGSKCEYEANECSSNPCLNRGICMDKVNGYECRCPLEFTGPNCNVSSCINYCLNGGVCAPDLVNGNICICTNGFKGPRCEMIDDPCESHPCQSNSKCVSRFFGHYECVCLFGYTGKFCEVKIDSCQRNPCIRGQCYTNPYGLVKCLCPQGFTGRYCEINLEVCEPKNPCLNGGKCQFTSSYNLTSCPDGVTGANCDIPINVCSTNPCRSKFAACIQNGVNSFECICPPFETGKLCETSINLCDPNPCPVNIKCAQVSYTETKCICPPGFTGTKCTERFDVCESNPCINGNCVSPLPGIFRCNCKKGYKGQFCHQSVILCDTVTCLNGGYCLNNSSLSTGFKCICPKSFTGQYCETPIDPCKENENLCGKNGECKYVSPGEYVCKCDSSCFYGKSCEFSYDPCSLGRCKNSANCILNTTNCSYKCECQPGFEGQNCEYNVNPCFLKSTPCFNGGSCVPNGTDSYYCNCEKNYSGEYCEIRTDPCIDKKCLNGGACFVDSHYCQATCLCQYGYTGLNCENKVDFCFNTPCLNNGKCTSLNSTFSCQCQYGFAGKHCEEQIDFCSLLSPCLYGDCYRGAPGNYSCFCYDGWTGKNCDTQILYCNSNPCLNGLCIDHIGGYTCQCSTGYTGHDCSVIVDSCVSNPCVNGICLSIVNPISSKSEYRCFCDSGFKGENCDIVDNLCENNGKCINNSTCKQLSVGFAYCDCKDGYEGEFCEKEINPCRQVTCYNGGECESLGLNKFKCSCLTGFTGTYCQIQNNLCIPNPCANGGACISAMNSYSCKCLPNFGGINCQFSQTCTVNPCQNSGLCKKLFDGTTLCICQPGFTGILCDKIINACDSNPCLNGAVCNRYNSTGYFCSCATGFKGTDCNQDIDECQIGLCKNSIKCENTLGSYKCTCKPGYTDKDCSVIITDACLVNDCSTEGTLRCVQTGFGKFICLCKDGYIGKTCNVKISPCNNLSCLNNGTCVASNDSNSYTCKCSKEFYGDRCQYNVDYCLANKPCGPYGICRNDNSTLYVCECIPGITGKNCETVLDPCSSNPCKNLGACVPSINFYQCFCLPTHYGPNCEVPADECDRYECYNGGSCINTFNGTACKCPPDFSGQQCEFKTICSIKCKNGGVCNSAGDKCDCPSNYEGDDCSLIKNYCLLNPCKNSALCESKNQSYVCICDSGFTGTNCEINLSPCDSDPCKGNGLCILTNSTSYSCNCFFPYSGDNCEIKKSLCDYINCGQGTCVPSKNDSLSANCECFPGYTGQYCNIKIQPCGSSPCKNGGQCSDLADGSFECKCAPEYSGPLCEDKKSCVDTFHYCSSLPCLNDGVCIEGSNCTFKCECTPSFSGEFCQFSTQNSIYTSTEFINLIVSSDTGINFNIEVQPCLVQAWKEANPQFSCPEGYEKVPGIDNRCFLVKKMEKGVNKLTAEYECKLNGASLVTFETRNKLDSITKWLDSKSLKNVQYWISSGIFRNSSDLYWIWASLITNQIEPINYDNWGAFQEKNFSGDSLYLDSLDYRFYVDLSNNNLTGFICESEISTLSNDNINLAELNQTAAFTSDGKLALKIYYLVNITSNETGQNKHEIRKPNATMLKNILKGVCGKEMFIENVDGKIYSFNNTFSIDIAGDLIKSHIQFIQKAILDSWLTARPEFLWCTIQRNCLAINILQTKTINIDYWNKITRIFYSVTVNDILIDPSQSGMTPTSDIMKSNIEKIKKNYYSNYILTGILVDSNTNLTFADNDEIKNQPFKLVVSNFVISSSIFAGAQIEASIINAFYAALNIDRSVMDVNVHLIEDYEKVLVLSEFYPRIEITRFNINPSQITYPATLLSFRIIIDEKVNLSPATQSLFEINQFYFLIQQEIYANFQLRGLCITSFILNENQPYFNPTKNFLRIQLKTNIIENDLPAFENSIKDFIKTFKIEFKHCKKCWNDTFYSLNVKYVNSDTFIDNRANTYYESWFAIVVKNQYENDLLKIVDLSEEKEFMKAWEQNHEYLYEKINSIPISFNNGKNFYTVLSNSNIRSLSQAILINVNQSILHEDVSPMLDVLKQSINLITENHVQSDKNFEIEYWGQREFIKKIDTNCFVSFWQAYFFARPINDTRSVFDPTYDFMVNKFNLDYFFGVYSSARSNLFNKMEYNPATDYATDSDLFYLPCFGSISPEWLPIIASKLYNLWINEYNKNEDEFLIQSSIQLESFDVLTLNYVNSKGSYSVVPYTVRAYSDKRLLSPRLYKEPDFKMLKDEMDTYCDIQDRIENLFREDSLNYIEAVSMVSNDQAKQYLPTITFAYMSYFHSINSKIEPNVQLSKPSQILMVENYFTNMMIVTKIYYKIFANTSYVFNAYNYQIKNTKYKITSPDYNNIYPILSRNMANRNFARIDLLNRAKLQHINLILAWLPKFSIDLEFGKELCLEQKLNIENGLINYWNQTFIKSAKQVKAIEVELVFSKGYFDTNKNSYSTLIYYIIAIDGLVKYEAELPRMENQSDLAKELDKIGFRISKKDLYSSIRSIYIDTDQRPVDFNFDNVKEVLENGWKTYLNEAKFSLSPTESLNINVKIIEQSLYYAKEKQLVGIKYAISINNLDPNDYSISDLPKYYIESKFSPFSIVTNSSLLARRMYVYSSRLRDEKTIINTDLMKEKISTIWKNKNLLTTSLKLSNVVFNTGFYKAETRNFYSNFFDVSFYRITYTQSINGIEPASLFYQSPKENDFDKEFLNNLGQNLMGFCFKDCFNYKQSGILIKKEYSSKPNLLDLIKVTWTKINQINSLLVNKNDIEISFITNKRSFKSEDKSTGLAVVLFNVKLNSKYAFNQIDSMDLKEPSKEDYFELFSQAYSELKQNELYSILDISLIKEAKPIGVPTVFNTNETSIDDLNKNIKNDKTSSLTWLIIVLSCLSLVVGISLIAVYTIRKIKDSSNKQNRRKLLKNDNESDSCSQAERDYGRFTVLANTFPQIDLDNDLDDNNVLENTRSNLNPNLSINEPIFNQTILSNPGINRIRENEEIVYPGLTIKEIVPNPIFANSRKENNGNNDDENLVTSVYVTGNLNENETQK